MITKDNEAPLLLDASRLVWRRWTGTRSTGIDRICLAWLEHYGTKAQAVIIHRSGQSILPFRTSQALFALLKRPARLRGDVVSFRAALASLAIRRSGHLRDRLTGHGRIWLNPGHTGLDSPRVAHWIKQRGLRLVPLVHDLIPLSHPNFCRAGEDERHRERMRTVVDLACGVIANSAHTLDSLQLFATGQGRPLPPAVVAWPGTPTLRTTAPSSAVEPTFVVLGTIEGRKNHALILSLWRQMMRSRPHQTVPRLIIVGRRGWQADDVFTQLDSGEFGDRVVEVGPLDDWRLAEVLSGARALLFPSFAEGYGMPLVEALASGVPVIASDLAVFREIGQGVPDLLPADDLQSWGAAVDDYARTPSQRRSAQLLRLEAFRAPAWQDHFARIDGFLAGLPAH
ncbi:MAG: glycosyltransferase family 1 protein [Porphyrobacter sp. IPPAS B-1204]|nr:MAG: glycosyltransferase family 1 protein [Porphyrobacter sp. IPPAS B-1204]